MHTNYRLALAFRGEGGMRRVLWGLAWGVAVCGGLASASCKSRDFHESGTKGFQVGPRKDDGASAPPSIVYMISSNMMITGNGARMTEGEFEVITQDLKSGDAGPALAEAANRINMRSFDSHMALMGGHTSKVFVQPFETDDAVPGGAWIAKTLEDAQVAMIYLENQIARDNATTSRKPRSPAYSCREAEALGIDRGIQFSAVAPIAADAPGKDLALRNFFHIACLGVTEAPGCREFGETGEINYTTTTTEHLNASRTPNLSGTGVKDCFLHARLKYESTEFLWLPTPPPAHQTERIDTSDDLKRPDSVRHSTLEAVQLDHANTWAGPNANSGQRFVEILVGQGRKFNTWEQGWIKGTQNPRALGTSAKKK
jgi:hypothetical protein